METYTYNKKIYYLAEDIMKNHPSMFTGCRNGREFLKKHTKELGDDYTYGRKNKNGVWTESDNTSTKFDKVFIRKRWFEANQPDESEDIIEDAPDEIFLEDNEKFFDNDGNVVEIEVRGERVANKCYFRVKDIMDGFELDNLHVIIIKNDSGYINNIHYKYFFLNNLTGSKKKQAKRLFLTYTGLMKVLFGSTKNTAEKFLTWATQTLFTAQMGTLEQKTKLTSKLLNVSTKVIKAVFNKFTHKMPCVYLFHLGKVKDLRDTLSIPQKFNDDDTVCKWGMSDDFPRRTSDHEKTFGKMDGVTLELIFCGYIDPQFMSKAETDLKHFFINMDSQLKHEKQKEIAIIPDKKMTYIRKQYEKITVEYSGHVKELNDKLKDKDHIIDMLKKDIDMLKKDIDIIEIKKDREIDNLKNNIEIMQKDHEIVMFEKNINNSKNHNKKK